MPQLVTKSVGSFPHFRSPLGEPPGDGRDEAARLIIASSAGNNSFQHM
jgi:hypothetical protein